jgi:hypothetical protein
VTITQPALALVVGLALAHPTFAHHSPSAFDQAMEVSVEGTITEVGWRNPHVYFTLATAGAGGAATEQMIHAGSVSALTAMGVARADLAVGRHVSVRGFPPRRAEARVILGFELTTQAGEILPLEWVGPNRAAPAPAPTVAAAGLSGRWLPQRSGRGSYIAEAQRRLNTAGQASLADVESYRVFMAGCTSPSAPTIMLMPMVHDVTVEEGVVRIAIDWMGAERLIHLDQTEHPADMEPSLQGHSIGRWEGKTLVVDTVAFASHRSGLVNGVASSAQKHVVERLSLTEDTLHLQYEVTIEDPEHLTEPVSTSVRWDHRPDIEPSGETCDPEVAGRFLELE